MRYHFVRWLIVVNVVFLSFTVFPQSYRIAKYTKNEGLPTELVKSVTQDSKGYLWLASDEGLIRFNGHKFELFKQELPNQYTKDLLTTSNGRVYATTDDALHEIISHTDHIEFKTIAKKQIREADTLVWYPKQLFEDKSGNVWFSDHFRPYRLIGDSLKAYHMPAHDKSFDWQRAYTFTDDGRGNLLILSQPGRWYVFKEKEDRLDTIVSEPVFARIQAALDIAPGEILVAGNRQVHKVRLRGNKVVSDSVVAHLDAASFLKKSDKEILVGTWFDGLYRMIRSVDGWQVKKVHAYDLVIANKLYRSKGGEVWTTSDNGLALFQQRMFSVEKEFSRKYIQSIRLASDGSVVYSDGRQVAVMKRKEDGFDHKIVYQKQGQTVLQAHPVEHGMWLGDSDGLVLFIDKEGRRRTFDFSGNGGAVFFLRTDTLGNVWFCQDKNMGVMRLNVDGTWKRYGREEGIFSLPLCLNFRNGELFVGGRGRSAFLYKYNALKDRFENAAPNVDIEGMSINDIAFDKEKDRIWMASSVGLFFLERGKVLRADLREDSFRASKSLAVDSKNNVWFTNSEGLVKWQDGMRVTLDEREGLPSKTVTFRTLLVDDQQTVWVGTMAGIAKASNISRSVVTPKPFFSKVTLENEIIDPSTWDKFYTDQFLSFQFLSPVFPARSVRYEWKLDKYGLPEDKWKYGEANEALFFSKLSPGVYTLKIRARQQGNYLWSKDLFYRFTVKPVWYQRWTIWLGILITIVLIVYLLLRYKTYSLNRKNEQLEWEVASRTAKIKESQRELERVNQQLKYQKMALDETAIVSIADPDGLITYANDKFCEISQYSRKELIGQDHRIINSGAHDSVFFEEMWETIKTDKWRGEVCNKAKDGSLYWVDATIVPFLNGSGTPYQYLAIRFEITDRKRSEVQLRKQKEEIERKSSQITSSINYASRIQNALLRTDHLIEKSFSEHFVLFRPRDIVSGDFYWVKEIKQQIIVAVGDCTGHGVPGAFMSMLGMTLLNDFTNTFDGTKKIDPAFVLEEMRSGVKKSLNQTGKIGEQKDGIDLALCIFDLETMQMRFSGAFNPAYYLSNGELITLNATKSPIGIYRKERPFKTEKVQLRQGDLIYLSTDGYPDQFDHKGKEPFKRHRLKKLIQQNSELAMTEQKLILETTHEQWKGTKFQIDDILVVGIRI